MATCGEVWLCWFRWDLSMCCRLVIAIAEIFSQRYQKKARDQQENNSQPFLQRFFFSISQVQSVFWVKINDENLPGKNLLDVTPRCSGVEPQHYDPIFYWKIWPLWNDPEKKKRKLHRLRKGPVLSKEFFKTQKKTHKKPEPWERETNKKTYASIWRTFFFQFG